MRNKQSTESAKDIAIMKNDIKNIKDDVSDIKKDIRIALDTKADKRDLAKIDSRMWQITMAIIVAFIGLIATAIKSFL